MAIISAELPSSGPVWWWQPPLHIFELLGATKTYLSTQQYSKNIPKMIQQSTWLIGGPNSRKSSGGGGVNYHPMSFWWGEGTPGIHLPILASHLSTTYYNQHSIITCWGGIFMEGNATIEIEFGSIQCVKIEHSGHQILISWHKGTLPTAKLGGGIECSKSKINK